MMLIDTDVLIDIALRRQPHAGPAAELLDKIEHGVEAANIAWHSVSNLYYIVAPAIGGVNARDFIADLIRFVPGGGDRHGGCPLCNGPSDGRL